MKADWRTEGWRNPGGGTEASAERPSGQAPMIYREMTAAHIREPQGVDFVEVVFLESARFYKLFGRNPAYAEILKLLREALAKKRIMKVGLICLDSDVIEEVLEV